MTTEYSIYNAILKTERTNVRKKERMGTVYPSVIWSEIIYFSCSAQLIMKVVLLINLKLLTLVNSFLLNIPKPENFSAKKYKNECHLLLAFSNSLAEKISCAVELCMKKSLITSGPGSSCVFCWFSYILLIQPSYLIYQSVDKLIHMFYNAGVCVVWRS